MHFYVGQVLGSCKKLKGKESVIHNHMPFMYTSVISYSCNNYVGLLECLKTMLSAINVTPVKM